MVKKELEQKLAEINQKLKDLGDLSNLIQQSSNLPELVNDIKSKQEELEKNIKLASENKVQLDDLILKSTDLEEQLSEASQNFVEIEKGVKSLQEKTENLIKETEVQLGKAANEKLANSFGKVKDELINDKNNWFNWLLLSIVDLLVVTAIVVIWQIIQVGELYHPNFIVKIAITSPLVYFFIFISREYNRTRSLIEEYTFKASIARSFEAYKDIIVDIFSEQQPNIYPNKLDFILKSITDLYSSPMKNIKKNRIKEGTISPDLISTVKELYPPLNNVGK